MKFEHDQILWCIAPDQGWTDDKLPVVKPWLGKLHIAQGDWGMVWTVRPIGKESPSKRRIFIDEATLFHTEKEARDAYELAERTRIAESMETIAKELEDLAEFLNEDA